MSYKAVIFDFDYTLGDCTSAIVDAVNYGLSTLNYPPADEPSIRKTVGMKLEDTFTALTGNSDSDLQSAFAKAFMVKADEVMTPKSVFLPHALETLQLLSQDGILLGIVTTKMQRRINAILEFHGVPGLIPYVCGNDNVKVPKPDPEGLITTIAKMGLSKKDVLYVGDTIIDAQAAQNAGVDFAAVTTGTTPASAFEAYPCVMIMEDIRPVLVMCRV